MKQEMCVLPVQCEKCNAVFDLWYDLQKKQYEGFEERQRIKEALRESLCWRCRQVVIEESKTKEEAETEDELILDYD